VEDRVAGAEQRWRDSGLADGAPDRDGLSVQLPLPAYQHVIACVSSVSVCKGLWRRTACH
jgi:hypothetical protein